MIKRKVWRPAFYVCNISKMKVSLRDLQITIPPGTAMDLLDQKHHNYSLEQLQKSATEGSLFLKRDKLKISNLPPPAPIPIKKEISEDPRWYRPRSIVKIENKKYEELEQDDRVSEEKFANEFTAEEELLWDPRKK